MKSLHVQSYDPAGDPDDVPASVQAVMALRYGLFPMNGQALYRFSGDRDFMKNLRAARKALDTAFKVEKSDARTSSSVRKTGCRILMEGAHLAALTSALDQAVSQGVPSNLIDGMDCASDWLKGAMEVDPNKPEKVKHPKVTK